MEITNSKAYTDLEQSKKLAEILPIETADMWIAERYKGQVMENGHYIVEEKPVYYMSLVKPSNINYSQDIIKDIPCWSLSALMDVLPAGIKTYKLHIIKDNVIKGYFCSYRNKKNEVFVSTSGFNVIDAVFEMIVYLKENKLI